MHTCTLTMELHIPQSGSLKAKRRVVRHILDTCRHRYQVAAAEVSYQGQWQRAELGFAAVAGTAKHVDEVLDRVESFVWSNPDVEVLGSARHWSEDAR